jgi:hypothetical protein
MEIRKSSSSVLNGVQNNSETENKADKSPSRGIGSAKDSFEVSSSSNQENSGTKDLSTAQQQEASKFNKDSETSGSTSQNGRATYEDAKNSGLAGRFVNNKESSEADSKKQLPNGVTIADLKNSAGQVEQSSAAVKDAQQKLDGDGRTNYRESLDQEVARRRQDITAHGGSSAIDRALGSRPDLAAAPKGKGNVPTGQGARESGYDDLPLIKFFTGGDKKPKSKTDPDEGVRTTDHNKKLQDENPGLNEFVKTTYINGGTDTPRSRMLNAGEDAKLNEWDSSDGKTHYKELKDGTIVGKSKDGTITVTKGDDKTVTHPDGSFEEYHDGKKTDSGGAMKTPGIDDRESANIPADIKKGIEYDMQQIRNSKPKTGGETELTDGGVTGNSADGSVPINNAFTRTGGVMGAVAQPTCAGEYVAGPSNGTVGSAVQNGGATDSLDGSSWTGTTHQDDPADVQFGPADQPKEQAGKKSEDSQDSSTSVLDFIGNQKRR